MSSDEDDYAESGTEGPGVGRKGACSQCGLVGRHTRTCVARNVTPHDADLTPKKNPITRGARNPRRRKS